MPNKYNIKANRQRLDHLIRQRWWKAFHSSYVDMFAEDADLCRSIVLCRNHQTTHRSLLHSLCDIGNDRGTPPETIHAVASSCPRCLVLHESGNERTPLHLAIVRGCSLSTIKALVEAADTDDKLSRQDLLLALDSKGEIPLISAVRGEASDDIIKYLVNEDVDGSSLLFEGRGRKKRQSGAPLKYVASKECSFVGGGLDDPNDLLRFMLMRTYLARWKKRFPKTQVDDDICLLQATIFCYDLFGSSKVASSILSYVIRNGLFDRERLDSRRDGAGNLTLHIACLSETIKFDQILRLEERVSDYGLSGDDRTLMEYLVNASPSRCTAPYLSKNAEGSIPLHCAIKSGKDWSQIQIMVDACPSSMRSFTSKGELPLHLAIKCCIPIADILKLWDYYPEAASMADISNGLYPFQLAAIFCEKRGKGKPKNVKKESSHSSNKQTQTYEQKIQEINDKVMFAKTFSSPFSKPDIVWDATSLSFFFLRECPVLLSATTTKM